VLIHGDDNLFIMQYELHKVVNLPDGSDPMYAAILNGNDVVKSLRGMAKQYFEEENSETVEADSANEDKESDEDD
jgi:hypothetical protein